MKATGEVMSICRTFESALLKALTSIEIKCDGLHIPFVSRPERRGPDREDEGLRR